MRRCCAPASTSSASWASKRSQMRSPAEPSRPCRPRHRHRLCRSARASARPPSRTDLARSEDRRVRRALHHQPAERRGSRSHRRRGIHRPAPRPEQRLHSDDCGRATCSTRTPIPSGCGNHPAPWTPRRPNTGPWTTRPSASKDPDSNRPPSTRSSSNGSAIAGYETIALVGIRDPEHPRRDRYLDRDPRRDPHRSRPRPPRPRPRRVRHPARARTGTMPSSECSIPRTAATPREVGVLFKARARDQGTATAIAKIANPLLLHLPLRVETHLPSLRVRRHHHQRSSAALLTSSSSTTPSTSPVPWNCSAPRRSRSAMREARTLGDVADLVPLQERRAVLGDARHLLRHRRGLRRGRCPRHPRTSATSPISIECRPTTSASSTCPAFGRSRSTFPRPVTQGSFTDRVYPRRSAIHPAQPTARATARAVVPRLRPRSAAPRARARARP